MYFYFYNDFVVIIVFLYYSLIVHKWRVQVLTNLKVLKVTVF